MVPALSVPHYHVLVPQVFLCPKAVCIRHGVQACKLVLFHPSRAIPLWQGLRCLRELYYLPLLDRRART